MIFGLQRKCLPFYTGRICKLHFAVACFAGFVLNMLALLPHMLVHFDEPDEFSKTCAQNIVQVQMTLLLICQD